MDHIGRFQHDFGMVAVSLAFKILSVVWFTLTRSGLLILHEQFCLLGGSVRNGESLVVDKWLVCEYNF